jgi:hypothetical protein
MTSNTFQLYRYTHLTKLTLTALTVLTLAYASEFFLIGQLDLEVGIVVAVLTVGAFLVASGWRWTPALGALLAGGILFGNPFLLHNLSLPVTSGFFLAAATQAVSSIVIMVADVGATIQNYKRKVTIEKS